MKRCINIFAIFLIVGLILTSCGETERKEGEAIEPTPIEENSPLSYSFDTGVITISGSGAMPEYNYSDDKPWDNLKEEVTKVIIENGVTNIGDYAFYDFEKLTDVVIGKDINSIGDSSFSGCDNLINYEVSEDNTTYSSENGLLYNKDKTIIISCPVANPLTEITLPESLTEIGEDAFNDCKNLSSITLPAGVKTINDRGFVDCLNLTTISLNEGLETIGDSALMDCNKLESIEIPSTVNSIGESALSSSRLQSITVRNGSTSFKSIDGVLYTNDMTLLVAFPSGKEMTTFEIPEGVTTIGKYAFHDANIAEIIFPSTVTTIEYGAFMSSNIVSVELNEGLKIIERSAFAYCDNITELNFPSTLISIEDDVLNSCDNLIKITINGERTSVGSILGSFSFGSDNKENITIYGYSGSSAAKLAENESIKFISIGNSTYTAETNTSNINSDDNEPGLFDSITSSVSNVFSGVSDTMTDVLDETSSIMDDVTSDINNVLAESFGNDDTTSNSNEDTSANSPNVTALLPSEPTKSSARVNMKIPSWLEDTTWINTNGIEYCKIDDSDIYFFDAYAGWISMKDTIKATMDQIGDIAGLQIQAKKNSSYVALVYNKDTGLGIKIIELYNFGNGSFDANISGVQVGTYTQIDGDTVGGSDSNTTNDFLSDITGGFLNF